MNDKYIPIHNLVSCLTNKYVVNSNIFTGSLMFAYILSGCDTIIYPFRRGKKRAAEIVLKMLHNFSNISTFGELNCSWEVTPEMVDEARQYFVNLYGHKSFDSLDKLREHVFATTKSDIRVLPPTEDAFHFHVLRSLYQFALYKRATMNDPQLPRIINFGRMIRNN